MWNINHIINNSKKKFTNDLNKLTDGNNSIKANRDFDIDNNNIISINDKKEENDFNVKIKDKIEKLKFINTNKINKNKDNINIAEFNQIFVKLYIFYYYLFL